MVRAAGRCPCSRGLTAGPVAREPAEAYERYLAGESIVKIANSINLSPCLFARLLPCTSWYGWERRRRQAQAHEE